MTLIYKGDIKARLTISTNNLLLPVDTVMKLLIKKPSGTVLTKTPSLNLTTGVATYDTILGDVDEIGKYSIQLNMVSASTGENLMSQIDTLKVYEKIE